MNNYLSLLASLASLASLAQGQSQGGHQVTPSTTEYKIEYAEFGATPSSVGVPSVASGGSIPMTDEHVAYVLSGSSIQEWDSLTQTPRSVITLGDQIQTGCNLSSISTTNPPHVANNGAVSFFGRCGASTTFVMAESDASGTTNDVEVILQDMTPSQATIIQIEDEFGISDFGGNSSFQVLTPGQGRELLRRENGAYVTVATTQTTAPGGTGSETFNIFRGSGQTTAYTDSLATVFEASTNLGRAGVWRENTNSVIDLIADTTTIAPNVPNSPLFTGFFDIRANNNGSVGFRANYGLGSGVGIWYVDTAPATPILTLLARNSSTAKDRLGGDLLGGTVTHTTEFEDPSINNLGHLAFKAGITGALSGDGLWAQTGVGGVLRLVAMTGTPIRNTNLTFTTFLRSGLPSSEFPPDQLAINDRDQIAFMALLSNDTYGLFVWDSATSAMLTIARTGTNYDPDNDPNNNNDRVIKNIRWNPGSNENGLSGFTHDGAIVYKLEFDDDGPSTQAQMVSMTTIGS